MNPVNYSPGWRDWKAFATFSLLACIFIYIGLNLMWTLPQSLEPATGAGEPDEWQLGVGLFFGLPGLLLLILSYDLCIRTVTISEETLSSRSPLGIITQSYDLSCVQGIRFDKNQFGGNGIFPRIRINGQWLFFAGNSSFSKDALSLFPDEERSNQSPQTRSTSGPV